MNLAIARRYAKALFELAQQDQVLDPTRASLEQLAQAFSENEDLSEVCLNPMFSREEHGRVLEKVMGRYGYPPLVMQFVNLLVAKHRIAYLPDIVSHFSELVDEARGRETVRVKVPRDLTGSDQAQLKTRLEEGLGQQVALSIQKEPSLLAGIAVQVGSQVFDGSVRGKLIELRQILLRQIQGRSSASA